MLCLPDTTWVGRSESESREVLAGVSLNAGTSLSSRFSMNPLTNLANRAIDFSKLVHCPRFCFVFWSLLDCAIDFSMRERSCRHFVVLRDLKGTIRLVLR